jgi:hypothetical protein
VDRVEGQQDPVEHRSAREPTDSLVPGRNICRDHASGGRRVVRQSAPYSRVGSGDGLAEPG